MNVIKVMDISHIFKFIPVIAKDKTKIIQNKIFVLKKIPSVSQYFCILDSLSLKVCLCLCFSPFMLGVHTRSSLLTPRFYLINASHEPKQTSCYLLSWGP